MLSTRMIMLIGYLKEHPRTSYKEIASALNIKELTGSMTFSR